MPLAWRIFLSLKTYTPDSSSWALGTCQVVVLPYCLWARSLIHLGAEPRLSLLYLISFLFRFFNFMYLDNSLSPPQLLPGLSYFPAYQLHVLSLCLFFPLFLCQERIQTNSHSMGKTCTGSNQAKSQHGYKWIQNFIPNEEAIAINTCWQRKLLEGPLLPVECVNHTPGRPHAQE